MAKTAMKKVKNVYPSLNILVGLTLGLVISYFVSYIIGVLTNFWVWLILIIIYAIILTILIPKFVKERKMFNLFVCVGGLTLIVGYLLYKTHTEEQKGFPSLLNVFLLQIISMVIAAIIIFVF